MSIAREPIDVRVSRQTLRFDDTFLPLHTITRAATAEIPPERETAVRTYAYTVASWLIPAAAVSALTPEPVSALVNLIALTWFAVSTARVAGRLRLRLHELTVDTTTGTHRILVHPDPDVVADIAFRITDALRDPSLEFHLRTETIQDGRTDAGGGRKKSANHLNHS